MIMFISVFFMIVLMDKRSYSASKPVTKRSKFSV
jgi:hypothetical protein